MDDDEGRVIAFIEQERAEKEAQVKSGEAAKAEAQAFARELAKLMNKYRLLLSGDEDGDLVLIPLIHGQEIATADVFDYFVAGGWYIETDTVLPEVKPC